jgi:hypothetical protein
MEQLIREESLANGLTLRFVNRTRLYYGDYYRVIVEVACRVAVDTAHLSDPVELAAARTVFGESVLYRRTLEQMGVPSTEIERVAERLVDTFMDHSLSYFAAPHFPEKILRAELHKAQRKQVRFAAHSAVSHE